MTQTHLFVMDPLESLNLALDSSLRMAFHLTRLGATVLATEPRLLGWNRDEESAYARARKLTFGDGPDQVTAGAETRMLLAGCAGIHMRKDPPFDMDYIATTWLLDTAVGKARIYNDPTSLRGFNEKLGIFEFPDASRPALLSADPDEILSFIEDRCQGDGIIKPLDLFGGRGVQRVTVGEPQATAGKARELLAQETKGGRYRLVQPFDRSIFEGEVRAFTAFGEPVAWCLKRPREGEYLANTRAGATLEPYQPSEAETERVTRVAEALMRQGVVFIGFDLIGGWISEINVTSPRLLQGAGDDRDYYSGIASKIWEDCRP